MQARKPNFKTRVPKCHIILDILNFLFCYFICAGVFGSSFLLLRVGSALPKPRAMKTEQMFCFWHGRKINFFNVTKGYSIRR